MFKKRLLIALAFAGITGLSFGNLNTITGIFGASSAIVECTGGGSESFTNIGTAATNYATRTWTGDNGISWQATDARTDQTLTGKAIAVRTGTVKTTSTVTGGVGTISFDYKRVFSGNSTLKLFVNGVQYGGNITVSSETPTTFTQVVNVSGNVVIELQNSGNRTVIDNVQWNCYSAVSAPELQIADAGNNNFDCDSLTVNFGSHPVNSYNDAIFYIKNTGTQNLNVSSLTLSDTINYSVVSPTGSFSVAPSNSSIVLVRFEGTTAGQKPATLTIASNDANEAECVVNLTGTALGACVAPADTDEIDATNVTAASADITVTGTVADNYLAVISFNSSLTANPSDTVNYAVNDTLGGGVVAYVGAAAEFTLSGLEEDSDYNVFVFPFNNVDCTGGPLYAANPAIIGFTTPVAPCIGANETFSNMGSNLSSYAVRTWTGDNGVEWEATDARTDQELNGDAIAIRTGSLTNTTPVTGGIGTLTFSYARVFTGNSTLKVFVNGVQYGSDVTVSETTPSQYSVVVDVAGDVTVEIENSGNRTIIDDVVWNCYQVPTTQEIQLLDSNLSAQQCGSFNLDFGNVLAGVDNERTFTIQNRGALDLTISDLIVSDTTYAVVSPINTSFVIAPQGTQDVTVRFNSAAAAVYAATLTIVSDDADESNCVVNLNANAQVACVAPDADGSVEYANVTDTSADVTVTGNSAADGYLALVLISGTTVGTPVDGTTYTAGSTLGDATVVYSGSSASFSVADLAASTAYPVYIYTYNSADCFGGPVYSVTSIEDEIQTTEAPCIGGSESFSNMGTNQSNYTTRTWTGDNGVVWTATDARTDQNLTDDAICVRNGSLTNVTAVSGGIGTLTFNYARVFSNNSTLKVFVNGVQFGGDITVSSTTPTQFSEVINVTGDVTIEIENSGNRTIIDDIAWDCYSGSSARQAMLPAEDTKDVKENNFTAGSSEVMLYPNPNNGEFMVELPSTEANADVTVFDALGKKVLSKKITGRESLKMENAVQGVYMVVITSGENVVTKKVVIK